MSDVITKHSGTRKPEWPDGVYGISLGGLDHLGINQTTGKLYWDGKEIVTRSRVRLDTFERWIAAMAAFGTVLAAIGSIGTFAVTISKALGWF